MLRNVMKNIKKIATEIKLANEGYQKALKEVREHVESYFKTTIDNENQRLSKEIADFLKKLEKAVEQQQTHSHVEYGAFAALQ